MGHSGGEYYMLAERLLGWRWLSFVDIPCLGTPGYPKECRVRRFFPPDNKMHPTKKGRAAWAKWFADNPTEPATGDEPLAYCYGSSCGPHMLPELHEFEQELKRSGRAGDYVDALRGVCGDEFAMVTASHGQRLEALVAVVTSPRAGEVK